MDLRRAAFVTPVLIASMLALSGCQAIGDIFKAGMWVGVVIAVLVVGLIGGMVAAFKRR